MIAIHLGVIGYVLGLVAVVRRSMPAAIEARLGEADRRRDRLPSMYVAERVNIALERQRQQVVHQPVMDVFALRQAKGDFRDWALSRSISHRDADPPLDLADVLEIGIQPCTIARAQRFLERAKSPASPNRECWRFCSRPRRVLPDSCRRRTGARTPPADSLRSAAAASGEDQEMEFV